MGYGSKGIQNLKNHAFFAAIDWNLLAQKQISPVFVPKIENSLDLSNIDRFFTREEPSETPTDDSSVLKKEKFDQFTYINENGYIPSKQSINEDEGEDDNTPTKNSLTDECVL